MSRWIGGAAAVGVGAAALCLVGALLAPQAAALGWLVAWGWAVNLLASCLALVMIAHVAPIRWFTPLRPALSAVAGALPVVALLFVPVIAGLGLLYPWVGEAPPDLTSHERHLLQEKRAWLTPVAWSVRSVATLIVWSALAWALRRLDLRGDARSLFRARALAGGGLLLLGMTWTTASVDWWMSLDPVWFSAILAIQRFSGGMVGAVALAILAARALERRRALPALPADVYHALGRLLLTFVILWTYTTYDQLMIQWIAGLPHEIRYWIPRLETGWVGLLWVLGLGHFVLPFALLLSRSFKRNPRALAALAAWLLVMRLLDQIHLTAPGHPGAGAPAVALGGLALLAHIGLLLAAAIRLGGGPVPRDALHWGLEYHSP